MRKLLIFFTLVVFQAGLLAQQRNHLPYSRFGLGELTPPGQVRSMGMGRSGIALSSGQYLNSLNPASYSAIDSVSFFFDVGMAGDITKYRTTYSTQYGNDVNLKNLALGFRINRIWSSSVGITPYSTVGYKIITLKDVEGTYDEFTAQLTGSGGLSQFYLDNSFLLFNRLSLGVSLTYLFGSIELLEKVGYKNFATDINFRTTSYLNKLYFNFGVQYFFPVKEKYRITLGGVFGSSHKLNFKEVINISQSDGTLLEEEDKIRYDIFKTPMYIGGGLAIQYLNKLTLSMDYLYHDWTGNSSDNSDFVYQKTNSYKLGIEYIPGQISKLGYFGRISYRAGYY
jgi:hypothetical protein